MRETYIDEIDNIQRIDAFVSYDEYCKSAGFRDFVDKYGIKVAPRAADILKERERAQQEAAAAEIAVEEKAQVKKCNGCAVVAAIFSVVFIAWCLLGEWVRGQINGYGIFALYGGESFVSLVKSLIGGGAEIEWIVATVLLGAGMLGAFAFGVIGSLATVKKQKTSMVVTVAMLIAFFCGVAVGVVSIVKNRSTELGAAIAVLIALAAFTASAIGRRNKAKENG